jgi:ATP-dependent HslUV protease ATP-binding subunit HslU
LDALKKQELKRILVEPKNALVKQYQQLMGTEDVKLEFREDAIEEIATFAAKVNDTTENIGARRLHTIMEKLIEDISFDAPDLKGKEINIDAAYVREKLQNMVEDRDLIRYVL